VAFQTGVAFAVAPVSKIAFSCVSRCIAPRPASNRNFWSPASTNRASPLRPRA